MHPEIRLLVEYDVGTAHVEAARTVGGEEIGHL
jgi:hypothetical protein